MDEIVYKEIFVYKNSQKLVLIIIKKKEGKFNILFRVIISIKFENKKQ